LVLYLGWFGNLKNAIISPKPAVVTELLCKMKVDAVWSRKKEYSEKAKVENIWLKESDAVCVHKIIGISHRKVIY
jgi:hypothetical protein